MFLWMHVFYEWITKCLLLLLGYNYFTVDKMHVFDECITDQPTDQPTDTAYYGDARAHLKNTSDYPLAQM